MRVKKYRNLVTKIPLGSGNFHESDKICKWTHSIVNAFRRLRQSLGVRIYFTPFVTCILTLVISEKSLIIMGIKIGIWTTWVPTFIIPQFIK